MSTVKIAKLFKNGRSQAVRLPREFRFDGDEVRIQHVADGVLLTPIIPNTSAWFAEMDRLKAGPFMRATDRKQPVTPKRDIFE